MRQEGGRSGRAGRNMPCDGLQDGTTPHMSFLRSNASEMQIATGFYMLVIGVRAGGERDGRGGRNITITRFLRANVPDCRHRGWKAIRGHISEGLGLRHKMVSWPDSGQSFSYGWDTFHKGDGNVAS